MPKDAYVTCVICVISYNTRNIGALRPRCRKTTMLLVRLRVTVRGTKSTGIREHWGGMKKRKTALRNSLSTKCLKAVFSLNPRSMPMGAGIWGNGLPNATARFHRHCGTAPGQARRVISGDALALPVGASGGLVAAGAAWLGSRDQRDQA